MNQGLELLMKRLETHPEEFTETGKWGALMERYEDYLPEEELKAFKAEHDKLFQEKFTEAIMKKLFEEEEKPTASPFVQAGMSGAGQTFARPMVAQQQYQQAQMGYNAALSQSISTTSSTLSSNLSSNTFREDYYPVNQIAVGGETLSGKMIKKLKKLIK